MNIPTREEWLKQLEVIYGTELFNLHKPHILKWLEEYDDSK